jgi:glycine C-acetyltransferase
MTSANALSYLSEHLENWRREGTYQRLTRAGIACEPIVALRRPGGNQSREQQLSRAGRPSQAHGGAGGCARQKYGAGSGAVRTISGTMSLHMELERRIAAFKRTEACVVFQSGFAANAGTVSAILGRRITSSPTP